MNVSVCGVQNKASLCKNDVSFTFSEDPCLHCALAHFPHNKSIRPHLRLRGACCALGLTFRLLMINSRPLDFPLHGTLGDRVHWCVREREIREREGHEKEEECGFSKYNSIDTCTYIYSIYSSIIMHSIGTVS